MSTVVAPITILCLVDRRRNPLTRLIRRAGFLVIESFSPDQAVAICAGNKIDIAVLDQEFFVETDGWSVAHSLKLVRRDVCILLVSRAAVFGESLPREVDAVVSQSEPRQVLRTIDNMANGRWHQEAGRPLPDRLLRKATDPQAVPGPQ